MHDETQNTEEQSMHVLVAGKLYAPEEIGGPVAVVLEGATIRDIWTGQQTQMRNTFPKKILPKLPIP